jgi:urease subunit gamma/beta
MRFEPGDERDVQLVAFGGSRQMHGLNRLTEGSLDDAEVRSAALKRATDQGFRGA